MAITLSSGPFAELKKVYETDQTTYEAEEIDCLTTLPTLKGINGGTADGFVYFPPHLYTQSPPVSLFILPYGEGTGDIDVWIILYHKTELGMYVPTGTCSFVATIADSGAMTGPETAGFEINDDYNFATTTANPDRGLQGIDCYKVNPIIGAAGFVVDLKSAHLVEIRIGPAEASAVTSANALVGTVNRTNTIQREFVE